MNEKSIRPASMFQDYLAAAHRDIPRFFSNRESWCTTRCIYCDRGNLSPAFEKLTFPYVCCMDCGSLFVNPRPPESQLHEFYRSGESVEFWSNRFYRETAEARREQIYRPRAELATGLASQLGCGTRSFVDIGAGFGIFLEEIARTKTFTDIIGIEPGPSLAAESIAKGFRIQCLPIEQLSDGDLSCDFATCFEVIEHVFSPFAFLEACARVLRPGGVLMMTTLTISGFDLQVLWDRSQSLHPPHHINFMSVKGAEILLRRAGLEPIEVSTPGKLDVDIVANARRADPSLQIPRFVEELLSDHPSPRTASFQDWLQKNRMSSHIRLVARRPIK